MARPPATVIAAGGNSQAAVALSQKPCCLPDFYRSSLAPVKFAVQRFFENEQAVSCRFP
jgi:hypothetical protein